jgi:hypothetical protein
MNLPGARRVQFMSRPHELEATVSRTAVKVHRAEIAMDAVLKPQASQAVMLEAVPSPQQAANGQNWRWWQDYGAGRHRRISVRTDVSQ